MGVKPFGMGFGSGGQGRGSRSGPVLFDNFIGRKRDVGGVVLAFPCSLRLRLLGIGEERDHLTVTFQEFIAL
jgi:hypothetical protein